MSINISKKTVKNTIINLLIIGLIFGPLLYLTNIIVLNYNNVNLIFFYWLWYLFAYIFIALAYVLLYQWLISVFSISKNFFLKLLLGISLSLLFTLIIYRFDIFYGKIAAIVYAMSINLSLLGIVYVTLEHRNRSTMISDKNTLEAI